MDLQVLAEGLPADAACVEVGYYGWGDGMLGTAVPDPHGRVDAHFAAPDFPAGYLRTVTYFGDVKGVLGQALGQCRGFGRLVAPGAVVAVLHKGSLQARPIGAHGDTQAQTATKLAVAVPRDGTHAKASSVEPIGPVVLPLSPAVEALQWA